MYCCCQVTPESVTQWFKVVAVSTQWYKISANFTTNSFRGSVVAIKVSHPVLLLKPHLSNSLTYVPYDKNLQFHFL